MTRLTSRLSLLFCQPGLVRLPQIPAWGYVLASWAMLWPVYVVARHLKHPLLYFWRGVETPLLLLVSGLCVFLAWRALCRAGNWRRKLEPGLRLIAWLSLCALVLAQEGWFRWQQHQVLQGEVATQRMGRHFVVGFRDFADLEPLAQRGLIGGIYLSRRNLRGLTAETLRARVDALQELRRRANLPPLFVMADQEGGPVAHLSPLIEPLPALATLVTDSAPESLEDRAYAYGKRQGSDLAALGVNMNLSPVVDLKPASKGNWRNLHTQIERRAIAADPRVVAKVATAYGAGLVASGVLPTVKHFPGLGRVQGDTHLVKASLSLNPEEQAEDWLPFREATTRTGAAMMLSHVKLPEIDPEHPASLSRPLVQDLLRQQWNYQGLLITDDLNMGAVYSDGIDRAATAALDAGVDLILVSYDPDQYYRALYAAAKNWRRGAINSQREAQSATRLDDIIMKTLRPVRAHGEQG
jgi:beta-N-acetylhexosaminidase